MLKKILITISLSIIVLFSAEIVGGFEGININNDLSSVYKLYKKKPVYDDSVQGYVFYPEGKIANMSNVHFIDIYVEKSFFSKKIKCIEVVFYKDKNDESILNYCVAHYGRSNKIVQDKFTTVYEFTSAQYDIQLGLTRREGFQNVLTIKDKDFPYWWEMNIK